MERVPAVIRDQSDLAATVDRARCLLNDGDYQTALMLSSGTYDQAKAAASYASRIRAGEALIGKARRLQADALLIESHAKIALADQVDEAQAAGMVAAPGRPKKVSDENLLYLDDIGLSKKQLHDARQLRDAEASEPGIVERAIEARIEAGLEPSRRGLGHAIGTRSASNAEKGDQLYETPAEATRTVLALESFSATVKEPFVGRGAILRVLEAAGYDAVISDLVDRNIATQYGELQQVGDFLLSEPGETEGMDIVTNPPYGDLANDCLAHALRVHKPGKMAALLNLNFMCGFDDPDRRYVMDEHPPSRVYVFTRRLPMMHRDGWEGNIASSQMNTGFFIWERNEDGSYGSGDGTWTTIRVDWEKYQAADSLPPGEGGHRSPMVFIDADQDFTRTTPRKTVDERVEEEFSRALLWMKALEPFDVTSFRKGVGLRNSVAEALIGAFAAEGLIEASADGLYLPTGKGLNMIATVGAVEMTKQIRAGKPLEEVLA
nr:hypothetical protein [Neorhizobium galegae]